MYQKNDKILDLTQHSFFSLENKNVREELYVIYY